MARKCKDIDENEIIEWLRNNGTAIAFQGYENYIGNAFESDIPKKLMLAKLKKMINKGVISGCACGCRGDFMINKGENNDS